MPVANKVSGNGSPQFIGEQIDQVWMQTQPAVRYHLDLTRPYHRALLRRLYKTCEEIGKFPLPIMCISQVGSNS